MADYQTFESDTTAVSLSETGAPVSLSETGAGAEHSRCIICLSNTEYESNESNENERHRSPDELPETGDVETGDAEKSNTPLMDIRVLCGRRSFEDGICNCRYNIHTSCFVETNKVFNNVCPMCRKNWWRKESDDLVHHNTDSSSLHYVNEDMTTCYVVLNKFFSCCIPSVIIVLFGVFMFSMFGPD
jgi:hypothetical protein